MIFVDSTRTAYKLVHRPDFSPETARVELLDGDDAILAYVSYHKESEHFSISCFVELPAHFVHDLLLRSKHVLLPHSSFRPRHYFSLLDRRELEPDRHIWEQSSRDCWLTDDLLQLLLPSLNWIPLYRPNTTRRLELFDMCATQAIHHDGAPLLAKLLEHWMGIFSLGPEQLVLTSGSRYPWSDDGTEEGTWYLEDGQPNHILFERDESIHALKQVRDMCLQLIESEESFFIFHEGL